MGWFQRSTKWAWDSFGNLSMLAGWIVSFAIPAWAAKAVEAANILAPLSWVAAGFLGVLIFTIAVLCAAAGRMWWVRASVYQHWSRDHDRINPLEDFFKSKRIALAELVSPFEQVIREKTFVDCEIIGPGYVLFLNSGPGKSSLVDNQFPSGDAIMLRNGVYPNNAIALVDCHFTRCKFHQISLLFFEQWYRSANIQISNLNWITVTPDHPGESTLFDANGSAISPQAEGH
jgi:hypothetical protein